VFRVVDMSGNGWRVGQNSGQNMKYLSATTTTGTGGFQGTRRPPQKLKRANTPLSTKRCTEVDI
jgi:hypothetical protein